MGPPCSSTQTSRHRAQWETPLPHCSALLILEIDNKMEMLHKNYTTIHYFPVRTSEFDTVEVQLCNVYGDNMVFYGGESAVVLHYRKVGEEM